MLTNRKEPHRVGHVQLVDGRQFFTKMRKSLGNKRNELSDAQIDDLVRIHGNFNNGETRDLTDEDPVTHQPRTRPRVVSKILPNEAFGYRKITVERPLRLNFAATPERIARIEHEKAFQNLAKPKKAPQTPPKARVAKRSSAPCWKRSPTSPTARCSRDRGAFTSILSQTDEGRQACASLLRSARPFSQRCPNATPRRRQQELRRRP